jgi:hypothetical protein
MLTVPKNVYGLRNMFTVSKYVQWPGDEYRGPGLGREEEGFPHAIPLQRILHVLVYCYNDRVSLTIYAFRGCTLASTYPGQGNCMLVYAKTQPICVHRYTWRCKVLLTRDPSVDGPSIDGLPIDVHILGVQELATEDDRSHRDEYLRRSKLTGNGL